MRKSILIMLCIVACFRFEASGFEYDSNLAAYEVKGTVHTIPGESWHCDFNWRGGEYQQIVILSDNLPEGMYIDLENYTFGWEAQPGQVGTYYIDFMIGKVPDPNYPERIWISDKCTVVVKVEQWVNPPQWEPMCGGL